MNGLDTEMDNSWTIADKKKLLMVLIKINSRDITKVHEHMPEKNITEIRYILNKYSKLASKNRSVQSDDKVPVTDSTLAQWIEIMNKTQVKPKTVYDIVPRVLKYIALFEDRPQDPDVNLRNCYLVLSEMCRGHHGTQLDNETSHFFYENLSKVAQSIKKNDASSARDYLKNMDSLDTEVKYEFQTYSRSNKRKRKFNSILNPLGIPDDVLKELRAKMSRSE